LADHFRTLKEQSMPQPVSNPQNQANNTGAQPTPQINTSNSNIFKAYRMIQLNKMDMKSFDDNVFQAYTFIEKDHGGSGVKGFDFLKLVKMLAVEYPPEVVHGLLR